MYGCLKTILGDQTEPTAATLTALQSLTTTDKERPPLQILVCEDNPINVKVAKHILKRFGYVPDIAEDGQYGIEACQSKQYDLILYFEFSFFDFPL